MVKNDFQELAARAEKGMRDKCKERYNEWYDFLMLILTKQEIRKSISVIKIFKKKTPTKLDIF